MLDELVCGRSNVSSHGLGLGEVVDATEYEHGGEEDTSDEHEGFHSELLLRQGSEVRSGGGQPMKRPHPGQAPTTG